MKIYLLGISLLLVPSLFGQDDLIDKIGRKTCECMEERDRPKDKDELYAALGLCMFESAGPYKDQLKREYNIDISKANGKGAKKLGEMVGMSMITVCPDFIMMVANEDFGSEEVPLPPADFMYSSLSGTIESLNSGQFYTLVIVDESNRRTSFLWLEDFDNSNSLLTDLESIKGKAVEIVYEELELFDAALGELRNFKVIRSLSWN